MSFIESADSLKAKAHLSTVRTPVLVGIAVIALVVVLLMIQGVWGVVKSDSFALYQEAVESESIKGSAKESVASTNNNENVSAVEYLYVHVGGAVANPGVYEIEVGARVQSAINAAGGFTEDAACDAVNLARKLVDGEQIIVASQQEVELSEGASSSGSTAANAKININTASIGELVTLPGIGESTAKKIIADRESNGPYASLEDLMRVSGIGEKKYADLANLICI